MDAVKRQVFDVVQEIHGAYIREWKRDWIGQSAHLFSSESNTINSSAATHMGPRLNGLINDQKRCNLWAGHKINAQSNWVL